MAKKAISKRKELPFMDTIERLAMVVPTTEDAILLHMSEASLHKFAEKQALKSVPQNKNITFLKEESSMKKSITTTNNTATAMEEASITSIVEETMQNTVTEDSVAYEAHQNILAKVAVVNIDLTRIGNREVSDVISKYCREINSAVRELNSGVIEHCKSIGSYDYKDTLFREVTIDYLNNFESDVLKVLVIQQLASVGQTDVELDGKSKSDLINASVQLFIINQEISRKQYLSTLPPSQKTLDLFNKLNDAVPTALSFATPTNALEASDAIGKLMTIPTQNMLNKAFKLAVEQGKNIPMDVLQKKTRTEISTVIEAFEELTPASEAQLNMIASVLKQLNEVYVAEKYNTLSKAKATRLLNDLNKKLLVKLSGGSVSLEDTKKMSYDEVNKAIAQYRQEAKMKYFDGDAKEKLGSILSSLGL